MTTQHGTSVRSHSYGMATDVPCVNKIVTGSFRTTPADYLRLTASRLTLSIFMAAGIPLTACLAGAIWDIRWLFVALIMIFLVFPTAIGYIYFTRLLTPSAQSALAVKHLEFHPDGTLSIIHESADEENRPPAPKILRGTDIRSLSFSGAYAFVEADTLGYTLRIPLDTLPKGITPEILEKYVADMATFSAESQK